MNFTRTQLILSAQFILDNFIILDTETTGLGDTDTIVEFAAVRASNGEVLADTLIKPLSIMNPAAAAVNGIKEVDALDRGACFITAYNEFLNRVCDGEYLTSYNRKFDERMVRQTAFRVGCANWPWPTPGTISCVMELANRALHEHLKWDEHQAKFDRLSLAKCCEILDIEFEGDQHRALADAKAARQVVVRIAAGDF